MNNKLIERYLWLIDLLNRRGRLTRQQINTLWMRSNLSDGNPIPRRTFYNYRQAIELSFGIKIDQDTATHEYFISDIYNSSDVIDMMLEHSAISNSLATARDIADKIILEPIPSARGAFESVVDSLRRSKRLSIDYHPYTRLTTNRGIILEPYLLKLVKKRWYMLANNVLEGKLKTYALDRIVDCRVLDTDYERDPQFDSEEYFRNAFGIVVNDNEVQTVVLRVDPHQAKYFRALPLHPTQQEVISDHYSLFSYRLRVTDDFVTELLGYGSRVTVVEPANLRTRMRLELAQALSRYEDEP